MSDRDPNNNFGEELVYDDDIICSLTEIFAEHSYASRGIHAGLINSADPEEQINRITESEAPDNGTINVEVEEAPQKEYYIDTSSEDPNDFADLTTEDDEDPMYKIVTTPPKHSGHNESENEVSKQEEDETELTIDLGRQNKSKKNKSKKKKKKGEKRKRSSTSSHSRKRVSKSKSASKTGGFMRYCTLCENDDTIPPAVKFRSTDWQDCKYHVVFQHFREEREDVRKWFVTRQVGTWGKFICKICCPPSFFETQEVVMSHAFSSHDLEERDFGTGENGRLFCLRCEQSSKMEKGQTNYSPSQWSDLFNCVYECKKNESNGLLNPRMEDLITKGSLPSVIRCAYSKYQLNKSK